MCIRDRARRLRTALTSASSLPSGYLSSVKTSHCPRHPLNRHRRVFTYSLLGRHTPLPDAAAHFPRLLHVGYLARAAYRGPRRWRARRPGASRRSDSDHAKCGGVTTALHYRLRLSQTRSTIVANGIFTFFAIILKPTLRFRCTLAYL